jgi:hypothetical protein
MQTNLLGLFCKLRNPFNKDRENRYWIVQTWLDSQDRVAFLLQHHKDGGLIKVCYKDFVVTD